MIHFSDKSTAYTDYVHNLDRLSVYVSDKPKLDFAALSTQPKCGMITRQNALFNPRLHFDCPEPIKGRYVYVKATGVPNRWRKLFTVVLCEVMAYWNTNIQRYFYKLWRKYETIGETEIVTTRESVRKVSSKLCLVSGGHATKGAKSLQCNAVVTAYIFGFQEEKMCIIFNVYLALGAGIF